MVFEGVTFGRWWGQQLMRMEPSWMGLELIASTMWGESEKTAVYESESRPWPDTDSTGTLTTISQPPELWEIDFVIAAQKG